MGPTQRTSALIAILVTAVLSVGCTQNQVLTLLNQVVTTSEALLPVIGSGTGIDQATQAQIKTYLDAVSAASASASQILAGPGSSAQKAAQIASAFAGIAAPILPAGTPQKVAALVQAVAAAVANLLVNVNTAPASTPATASASARTTLVALEDRAMTIQDRLNPASAKRQRMLKR